MQSDTQQYLAMSKQLQDYRIDNDEELYWIDNAYCGMPTYQLGAKYPYDILNSYSQNLKIFTTPFIYDFYLYARILCFYFKFRI